MGREAWAGRQSGATGMVGGPWAASCSEESARERRIALYKSNSSPPPPHRHHHIR